MQIKTVEQQTQEFNDKFFDEIQEIIILTPNTTGGAGMSQGDVLWTASQYLIAYIDKNNQLIKADGRVQWLAEEDKNNRFDYGYKFNPVSQYRLKVRRAKPAKAEDYLPFSENENFVLPDLTHYFMLLEVIETDVHEPRLDAVKEEFLQPVVINNELGEFSLDKEYNSYSGEIDWLGEDVSVTIEGDDNDEVTQRCFSHLSTMVKNTQDFDQKMRQFASEKLLENAQEWQDDSDEVGELEPLTNESFIARISLSELAITDDEGNFSAYFDDGDLFWGHVIIVDGNVNGDFDDAYIAG